MSKSLQDLNFRLYWLRESGCDHGVRVGVADLEPAIRDRVVALAENNPREEWILRLPFLDEREWRKRDQLLRHVPFERIGNLIRAVLDPAAATRDMAATYVLTDPAWQHLPRPENLSFCQTWRRVSLALQKGLKKWIPREYFADLSRFEDRGLGYPVIAYQASRLFFGKSRTDFIWDLSDYPACRSTPEGALRLTGRATQDALAEAEDRLKDEGRPELALRYAPVWYEDVLVAAKKKPKILVALLAAEAAVINAVVDLGGDPRVAQVNRSARSINAALRNVMGIDMRRLGCMALDEVTRVLAELQSINFGASGEEDVAGGGAFENADMGASGGPHARVGR